MADGLEPGTVSTSSLAMSQRCASAQRTCRGLVGRPRRSTPWHSGIDSMNHAWTAIARSSTPASRIGERLCQRKDGHAEDLARDLAARARRDARWRGRAIGRRRCARLQDGPSDGQHRDAQRGGENGAMRQVGVRGIGRERRASVALVRYRSADGARLRGRRTPHRPVRRPRARRTSPVALVPHRSRPGRACRAACSRDFTVPTGSSMTMASPSGPPFEVVQCQDVRWSDRQRRKATSSVPPSSVS